MPVQEAGGAGRAAYSGPTQQPQPPGDLFELLVSCDSRSEITTKIVKSMLILRGLLSLSIMVTVSGASAAQRQVLLTLFRSFYFRHGTIITVAIGAGDHNC